MKKILHILTFGIALSFATNFAVADDGNTVGSSNGEFVKVGAAGSQFLKIGVGARGTAMAANAAVANDLSSIWWNPAGLASVKTTGADFEYTSWFAGFSNLFAAVSLPINENFTAAISVTSFTSEDIEITTLQKPEGTGHYYTVSDMAVAASIAGFLTEDFSFGVNFKYINNGFATLSSNTIGFDVGTLYNTGLYGIKLGFEISNLGGEMQYTGQDLQTLTKLIQESSNAPIDAQYITGRYKLPLIFRAGLASEVYKDDMHAVTVAGDFTTYSDVAEQFALGAEYTFKDLISVRGGYTFNHDQFNISGGVGIKYNAGGMEAGVDYSINPTSDLGLVHRLNIRLGF